MQGIFLFFTNKFCVYNFISCFYNLLRTDKTVTESGQDNLVNQRCESCLSIVARGQSHICNSSTRVKNLEALMSKSSSQVKNQVISSTLKKKVAENANIDCKTSNTSISINQRRGKPLKIDVNPKNSKEKSSHESLLTTDDMKKIQSKYSLTQNVTVGIASMLRVASKKRKIIQPNLRKVLSTEIHSLDSFFDVKVFKFKNTKNNKTVDNDQAAVYCKNLKGLIEHLKEKRNVSSARIKFGIDGGGGSLKICMSIQSTENDSKVIIEDESGLHLNKRQKYSEGVASKSFEDSGVKKLIILALVQNVQENYDNVKLLWREIGIDKINGTIAADIKLCNIMAGIMPSSSSFPCTWCTVSKNNLHESSTLRTSKNIIESYTQWLNAGGKKELAKNYMCCISPPIFNVNKDTPIIEIMNPPELHLLLGIVNLLFNHMYKAFKKIAVAWAKMCNAERQITYGGQGNFNGNDCKKLLDKLDDLRRICPIECLKYVQVLSDFRKVVDGCFGRTLNPEFAKYIDSFKKSYLGLEEVPVTPKVHCVFVHVKEFCQKHNVGLGIFSEQAFESVHHEFKIIWNKHKVRPTHSEYKKHLLRAVCEFNGLHV